MNAEPWSNAEQLGYKVNIDLQSSHIFPVFLNQLLFNSDDQTDTGDVREPNWIISLLILIALLIKCDLKS